MAIVNNQGVFIRPTSGIGEGGGIKITSFREDDDFSVDIFDASITLPSFPNNIGIAFVRSSESPADYATIALQGTNTSTIYADNTSSSLNFVVSNDVFVGYNQGANLDTIRSSFIDYVPSSSADLFVEGRIYANGGWGFRNTSLFGVTRFGTNTIEINDADNSISGVGIITANVGIITTVSGVSSISGNSLQISGITTITPTTELNVNGGLIVSGVSTVGVASTSNLTINSTLTCELTSNTNLRIKVRGTDGVIRSTNLTLS